MKDQIILTGIHGFGYHGVFDHERKDGQDFFVDLTLSIDLTAPSNSDAIEDTVNYAEITDLVVEEITSNPVNLIENNDTILMLDFDLDGFRHLNLDGLESE